MLQNFLGNVISLSNIYNSIEDNMKNNRTIDIHYDVARIVRLLTIFEPVELKDDEIIIDGNGNKPKPYDGDSIPDPDINKFFAQASSARKRDPNLPSFLEKILSHTFSTSKRSLDQIRPINLAIQDDFKPGSFVQAFDDKTKGSLTDFDFKEILEIAFGFLNATQVTYGKNRTECQLGLETLSYSADRGYTILSGRWFNWFDFWFAIDKYLFIPYSLYSI